MPSTIVSASKYNSGPGSLGDQVEQLQRRGGEDIETSSMLPQDQRWAEIPMTSLFGCILIPNIYDAGDKSINYVVYTKPAISATIVTPMVSQEMVEIARHLASMYTTNPTLVPFANHINLFPSRSLQCNNLQYSKVLRQQIWRVKDKVTLYVNVGS